MKWKFVNLQTGWDIQIVSTESERDRFIRHCRDQRIRYGLVRVDEDGVYGDLPDTCSKCEVAREHARRREGGG